MHGDAARLGEWVNKPDAQRRVAVFIANAEGPVLLREVAEGCSIPLTKAAKILDRLHAKGTLARYKIPIQRRNKQGWSTRRLWLYSPVEEGAE